MADRAEPSALAQTRPTAVTAGDLTRLACLWSQQELCGRRPVKVDPFAWACKEANLDSFLLFVRLKQLPKVPSFCEAVVQQQRIVNVSIAAGPATWPKTVESLSRSSKEVAREIVHLKAAAAAAAAEKEQKLRRENVTMPEEWASR